MLYLQDKDIWSLRPEWPDLVDMTESAVRVLDTGEYAQPLKPYLRYGGPKNRIIAMPAYIGGSIQGAGIKWIASFPGNLERGLPRAHSVTVLNDPETGKPVAILNTSAPSIIRTAAVSGLMLRHYLKHRPDGRLRMGIIGFGPIGRHHLMMALALGGHRVERVRVHDLRKPDLSLLPEAIQDRVEVVDTWEEAYLESDVCMTCTVSERRYIHFPPKPGSLLLHVSLRDYVPEALASVKTVIVDDWDEVCREDTDIERLYLEKRLVRQDAVPLADVVCRGCLSGLAPEETVLFSPMGMGVFDIATAVYLAEKARQAGIGLELQ